MKIIAKLASILDDRVAAEAEWTRIDRIASLAATECEYLWLIESPCPEGLRGFLRARAIDGAAGLAN